MRTIVEPKQHIAALWSKPEVRNGETFRMMRYVLRVDHDGKVLLHNVVTGQLVVLDQEEADILNRLPLAYCPVLEALVNEHYLVPENYDEHQQVVNLRIILRKLADIRQGSGLTLFTILPTTACNARCYYCFERGIEAATMTENIANEVIKFITTRCNGKKVCLKWFGGEPTVAANRITQICEGLKANRVSFSSIMTTNGYLFDEEMCEQAKHTWNLERVVLSVDGTGDNYNKIKAYVGVKDNPYERILRNIGLLLDQRIRVWVRMNFDQTNYAEFGELIADIREKYPPNPYLQVCSHYINDVQIVDGQEIYHGSETWYNEKIHELHQLARSEGYLNSKMHLPYLECRWCPAASGRAVTITPMGKLVSCYEFLGDEEVKGDVWHGIVEEKLDRSWRQFADVAKCSECVLFPNCAKILRCKRNEDCLIKTERLFTYEESAIRRYENSDAHI